jgi:hypothetical protein
LATWLQLDTIGESLASNREFVSGNLWILTVACSLMSVLLYARFVILHASGEIYVPERQSRQKSKKRRVKGKLKSKAKRKQAAKRTKAAEDDSWSDESEDESVESIESDEEDVEDEEDTKVDSGRVSGKSSRPAPRSNDPDAEEDEDDGYSSGSGLSRAERKRLKREQRQSRRAA